MRSMISAGRLGCALTLAIVLAGSTAEAQKTASNDPSLQAKSHADRARRLYDLRRYDEAAYEFDRAWRLSNDPSYIYNVAQAYRLAGKPKEAVGYYEYYLTQVPAAPNRAEIEKRMAELRGAEAAPVDQPAAVVSAPPTSEPPTQQQTASPAPTVPPPQQYPEPTIPSGYPATSGIPPGDLPSGHHRHDGFYLRLMLGASAMKMDVNGQDRQFSGLGGNFAVAIGWSFADRFVLYAETLDGALANAKVKQGPLVTDAKGEAALLGIGLGGAFYVMPVNVYLSLTLSMNKAESTDGLVKRSSGLGPGATLCVGKEFWVASDFGLGAAFQFHASSTRGSGTLSSVTWRTTWFAGVVSATFN